jgi:hypothetical protein
VQINDFEFHFQNIMSPFRRQENISAFLQMPKRGTSAVSPGRFRGKLRMAKGLQARKIKRKKERLQGWRAPGAQQEFKIPTPPGSLQLYAPSPQYLTE